MRFKFFKVMDELMRMTLSRDRKKLFLAKESDGKDEVTISL